MANQFGHFKPLTVFTGDGGSSNTAGVVLDGVTRQIDQANHYYYVVYDRVHLSVMFEYSTTENKKVPDELSTIATSPQAKDLILVICTNGLAAGNYPQGELHDFLHANGGGEMLIRMEQIATQLGTGGMGYGLVSVMGESGHGFETMRNGTADNGVMTLKLMPTDLGGKTLYTPVEV